MLVETLFPNPANSPNLQCFPNLFFTLEMDPKLGSVTCILTADVTRRSVLFFKNSKDR